jgi:hypothetical protein
MSIIASIGQIWNGVLLPPRFTGAVVSAYTNCRDASSKMIAMGGWAPSLPQKLSIAHDYS